MRCSARARALLVTMCAVVVPTVSAVEKCGVASDFGLPFNVTLTPPPTLVGSRVLATVTWRGCAASEFNLRFEDSLRDDSSLAVVWLQRADPETCAGEETLALKSVQHKFLELPLEEDFAFVHSDILFAFPPDHQFESYRLKPDFIHVEASAVHPQDSGPTASTLLRGD